MADTGTLEGSVEVWRRRVAFGDCDPAQIVYYPNYFAWIDEASHALFARAGLAMRELEARLGVTLPIVNVEAQFRLPASWDDEIAIESVVSRWGGKSLTVSHRIFHSASGATIADAQETRVCVRVDPAKPGVIEACPIPAEVRAAF
jgi:4-hydroxybenzoyl-CoA thioesterase